VVRGGDAAPGTSEVFHSFLFLRLADDSSIAFSGNLDSVGDVEGFWIGTPGALAPLALPGDPVAGFDGDVVYGDLGKMLLGGGGVPACSGSIAGTGIDAGNDNLVWKHAPDGFMSMAREGKAAPGFPDEVLFTTVNIRTVSDNGTCVISGEVSGPGVTAGNSHATWIEGEGDQLLHLVVRQGDHPPGTPQGVTFGFVTIAAVNDSRQVLFQANVQGAISGTAGVWGWSPRTGLFAVAAPGSVIQVAPGDTATISGASLSETEAGIIGEGFSNTLGNAGGFALTISFEDGRQSVWSGSFPHACAGDADGDGDVDVDDLNNVILDWGTDGSANGGDVTGPFPGDPPDGIVDVNDLNAVIVNWGDCP
jgi:hypothetical protein